MVRLQLLPQTVLADPMAPLFLGSLSCHVLFLLMAMVVHNFFMFMVVHVHVLFKIIVVHAHVFHNGHSGSFRLFS